MSRSIISNAKECYICKTTLNLHKHHIFHGTANRRKSEEDGAWVYLCMFHHTGSSHAAHTDKAMDEWLQRIAQGRWEEVHGTREEFVKRYGRNYIG